MKKCCCCPLVVGVNVLGWMITCLAILYLISGVILIFTPAWGAAPFLLFVMVPNGVAAFNFFRMLYEDNYENRKRFALASLGALGFHNFILFFWAASFSGNFARKVKDAYGPNLMWLFVIVFWLVWAL